MTEHDDLAAAHRLEAMIANEYGAPFNEAAHRYLLDALAAARADGAAEAFERAAKTCSAIADRATDRACSGSEFGSTHPSDYMSGACGCANAIRALAEKERGK